MTTSANMAKRFVAPTFSSVPQTVSFAQDGVIPPIRYASLGETGFAQSRETALEIVEANPEALTMVTKWLYPAVAKRHQTNWKQVERNLRIAVRTAWGTNRDFLQKLSPLPVKKRPTVSQFISILWKTDT